MSDEMKAANLAYENVLKMDQFTTALERQAAEARKRGEDFDCKVDKHLPYSEIDAIYAQYGLSKPDESLMFDAAYRTIACPVQKLFANNYNPNKLSDMAPLYQSIKDNSYVFPVLTVFDPNRIDRKGELAVEQDWKDEGYEGASNMTTSDFFDVANGVPADGAGMAVGPGYAKNKEKFPDSALIKMVGSFVVIDGFHRYRTMMENPDILARSNNLIPIVVLQKTIEERISTTVMMNTTGRIGAHDVSVISSLVGELRNMGRSDSWIMKHLGIDGEELNRYKQVSGVAALFVNQEPNHDWEPAENEAQREDIMTNGFKMDPVEWVDKARQVNVEHLLRDAD